MTDLHTRLVEAITARLNLAEAALADRASGWWWGLDAESACERHIAANHPGHVIRACRADLELLEQHRPPVPIPDGPEGTACATCGPFGDSAGAHWWDSMAGHDWTPCDFVRNRAGVYGVNLDEQEG